MPWSLREGKADFWHGTSRLGGCLLEIHPIPFHFYPLIVFILFFLFFFNLFFFFNSFYSLIGFILSLFSFSTCFHSLIIYSFIWFILKMSFILELFLFLWLVSFFGFFFSSNRCCINSLSGFNIHLFSLFNGFCFLVGSFFNWFHSRLFLKKVSCFKNGN